jgi:multidrug resistance efflux pump
MVELADQDLTLERRKWTSELGQQESAYATALTKADRPAMVIALSRADEARAHLGLIDAELARARIVAPFDGVVIQGDLSQNLGAPVERGKTLMLLAPGEKYRVVVDVDERDIGSVRVGQTGSLSLSALPWETLAIVVSRVTPIAKAVDGNNVFEVETEVAAGGNSIRPGLEGVAKIGVARRSLAWAWFHRVAEWTRITLWAWWP